MFYIINIYFFHKSGTNNVNYMWQESAAVRTAARVARASNARTAAASTTSATRKSPMPAVEAAGEEEEAEEEAITRGAPGSSSSRTRARSMTFRSWGPGACRYSAAPNCAPPPSSTQGPYDSDRQQQQQQQPLIMCDTIFLTHRSIETTSVFLSSNALSPYFPSVFPLFQFPHLHLARTSFTHRIRHCISIYIYRYMYTQIHKLISYLITYYLLSAVDEIRTRTRRIDCTFESVPIYFEKNQRPGLNYTFHFITEIFSLYIYIYTSYTFYAYATARIIPGSSRKTVLRSWYIVFSRSMIILYKKNIIQNKN